MQQTNHPKKNIGSGEPSFADLRENGMPYIDNGPDGTAMLGKFTERSARRGTFNPAHLNPSHACLRSY